MGWKFIVKYSFILYVALVLSGIPIGYIMADIDPSGSKVPSWLVAYKYLASFLICLVFFFFFVKKQTENSLRYGIQVVLIVIVLSSLIELLIFKQIDYFSLLLDLSLMILPLFLWVGISFWKSKKGQP